MGNNPSVRKFKTDMQDFAKNVATDFHTAALLMADEVIGNMQRAISHNVSGHLKESVRKKDVSTKDGTKVSILILAGGKLTTRRTKAGHVHDYSTDEEFGNVKEAPHPFFYGTYRAYKAGGMEFFKETLEDTIKENNIVRGLRTDNYHNPSGPNAVTRSVGHRGAVVIQTGKRP